VYLKQQLYGCLLCAAGLLEIIYFNMTLKKQQE
jgi:hypothetical protein